MTFNKIKESRINADPSFMKKVIKIQAFIRRFLIRKKFLLKSPYRTKETEENKYYKDNGSEIRSINIGSDIMNGGGVSNGAYSSRYNNQRAANLNLQLKQTSTGSDDKGRITLKDIVRK